MTGHKVEHFAIGGRYDVLTGVSTQTMRLTTLVGYEGDEGVGNDSFIGAIGTVEGQPWIHGANDYYVVRRHQPEGRSKAAALAAHADLSDEPVRIDIQMAMAQQLTARLKTDANDAERKLAESVQPSLKVQPFHLDDGGLRYYARAEWRSGRAAKDTEPFALAAWFAAGPTLKILAVEKRSSPYGFEDGLPRLLNVVGLGSGRTGIIVQSTGLDSQVLILAEYRDGVGLHGMTTLHSISAGE